MRVYGEHCTGMLKIAVGFSVCFCVSSLLRSESVGIEYVIAVAGFFGVVVFVCVFGMYDIVRFVTLLLFMQC